MRPRWWTLISILVAASSFSALYYIVNHLWPNPDTAFAISIFAFLFLGLGAVTFYPFTSTIALPNLVGSNE
jgi:hypothetical protein